MTPARTRAFLSYSRRDRDWVEAFHEHLNLLTSVNNRIDLFWDNQTEPGATWNTLFEAEVDAASSMVLIATPEALASPDVQKERNQFVQRTKNQRLYVVRRVALDLPQAWSAVQRLDCTEPGGRTRQPSAHPHRALAQEPTLHAHPAARQRSARRGGAIGDRPLRGARARAAARVDQPRVGARALPTAHGAGGGGAQKTDRLQRVSVPPTGLA